MYQNHLRMSFESAVPVQQSGLVGMRRQPAYGVPLRLDFDGLAEKSDFRNAVDQQPAERTYRLVADDEAQ